MTKHTPGPWSYRGTLRTYIVEPKHTMYGLEQIAVIKKSCLAESQHNARLIADAPELLELCQELLGPMIIWSQYWASMYNGGKLSPAHEEIIQRASIVIARNTPTENAE